MCVWLLHWEISWCSDLWPLVMPAEQVVQCPHEHKKTKDLILHELLQASPCSCTGWLVKAAAGISEETRAVGSQLKVMVTAAELHGDSAQSWPLLSTVRQKYNCKGLQTTITEQTQTSKSAEQKEREGEINQQQQKTITSLLLNLNYFQEHHDLIWEQFILNLNSQIKNQTPRDPFLFISLFGSLNAFLIEVSVSRREFFLTKTLLIL